MKEAGFYREFEDEDEGSAPSLKAHLNQIEQDQRKRVCSYLRGGTVILVAAGIADDVLGNKKNIGPYDIRTDGHWAWYGFLPYYVEHYGLGLPESFLLHMEALQWKAPILTDDERRLAARDYSRKNTA